MEGRKTQETVPPLKFAPVAPKVWEALGKLERTGWVRRGIKNPETVQEHIVALRVVAATIEGLSETNKTDLIDMLEIHDWPEAEVGDQVIVSENPAERKKLFDRKFEEESDAMAAICATLGEKGDEIFRLWLRFETSPDEIATLAREIDKFQAIVRAWEYEQSQGKAYFKEFLDYARPQITHPTLVARLEELEREWQAAQK